MTHLFTRQTVKINMDYKQFLNKISGPLDDQPPEKKSRKTLTLDSPIKFTYTDLYRCLYRQNDVQVLDTTNIKQYGLPSANNKSTVTFCKLIKIILQLFEKFNNVIDT